MTQQQLYDAALRKGWVEISNFSTTGDDRRVLHKPGARPSEYHSLVVKAGQKVCWKHAKYFLMGAGYTAQEAQDLFDGKTP